MNLVSDTWDEVAMSPGPPLPSRDGAVGEASDDLRGNDEPQTAPLTSFAVLPTTVTPSLTLTVRDYQLLLMGLCLKPETEHTMDKLTRMVGDRTREDASFVLFSGEDGCTPLHYACKANNVRIATYLVEHTAIRAAQRNGEDETALHYAVRHRNVELVDVLMRRFPARETTHGRFGPTQNTLLHEAVSMDDTATATLVGRFVCAGSDPLLPNSMGVTAYALAKQFSPSRASAFFLNNYVLNRRVYEDRALVTVDSLDDELVRTRRRQGVSVGDGYAECERLTLKFNEAWWCDGYDRVAMLCSYLRR